MANLPLSVRRAFAEFERAVVGSAKIIPEAWRHILLNGHSTFQQEMAWRLLEATVAGEAAARNVSKQDDPTGSVTGGEDGPCAKRSSPMA